MQLFSKHSLEALRDKVDLVDLMSGYIDLKKSGSSYKGLCPFHDEKTPSFIIHKGDTHYHCFGCGAHGDAVHFLMHHAALSFKDAIEHLAERFGVILEYDQSVETKAESPKKALKEALEIACQFYQFCLLHTEEGHAALRYLFNRGIDLEFILRFRIGFAIKQNGSLQKILQAKYVKDVHILEAGLLVESSSGGVRDFFSDRIMFPICDTMGHPIGFSARKFKEETFGGKYINTKETPLFKKSDVLFGLHHSRKRIAKTRLAIVVEGQIDALRLISLGFDVTVAGQGTAFGESHVKELLKLGVTQVYLALDGDEAGRQATCKVGDLFQYEGVEVRVIQLPKGSDPDQFLQDFGPDEFLRKMDSSLDYLTFLVDVEGDKVDLKSPAGKNALVQTVVGQIRKWKHALMVHESLRKLAHLMQVPEAMLGVGQEHLPTNVFIKKSDTLGIHKVDPDRILETDFLRWLLLFGHEQDNFKEIAKANIKQESLRVAACRKLYQAYIECYVPKKPIDYMAITAHSADVEVQSLLSEIYEKKINTEKKQEGFTESIRMILHRNWMQLREDIRMKIQSSMGSDQEIDALVKQFSELNRSLPKVQL